MADEGEEASSGKGSRKARLLEAVFRICCLGVYQVTELISLFLWDQLSEEAAQKKCRSRAINGVRANKTKRE